MLKIMILSVSFMVLTTSMPAEDVIAPASVSASPKPVERTTEEIILLPKMVVRGADTPRFDEREIYNQSGLNELLRRRFPGASVKGQPREVDNYALFMYGDEKRLEALNKYQGLADVFKATGDVEGSKELRRELNRTFIRGHDSKSERMEMSANGGRR